MAPLSLSKLTFNDRQSVLERFAENQKMRQHEFDIQLEQQRQQLQRARVYCPYASFDEITMYAMIGHAKDPDLLVKDSVFDGKHN